jgi:hypothetical protein
LVLRIFVLLLSSNHRYMTGCSYPWVSLLSLSVGAVFEAVSCIGLFLWPRCENHPMCSV